MFAQCYIKLFRITSITVSFKDFNFQRWMLTPVQENVQCGNFSALTTDFLPLYYLDTLIHFQFIRNVGNVLLKRIYDPFNHMLDMSNEIGFELTFCIVGCFMKKQ